MKIEIQNLRKKFGSREVLKGLSLNIEPGAVSGLVGPNACGKTTLIKCILGLTIPTSGEILVGGKSIHREWDYRRKIGYMPQNPNFPPNLTFIDLLEMLEDLRNEDRSKSCEELVDIFGLRECLDKPFSTMSGGTKQKCAAVAAFMFDPDILILDEPSVGLDPVAALKLKELVLQSVNKGKSVLLVSHIMTEVEQLVQRMVFLLEGEAAFSGNVDQLREQTGEDKLENAIVKMMLSRKPERAFEIIGHHQRMGSQ
ncbi:MAG: ABC transporter ATP-binding protein [Bdellovibrionales bacterium]|nr:ABC transporter ATP-binding protein [Bdellovibrionales bacterium]